MPTRDRSRTTRSSANALALAVALTLILGWAFEPHATRADVDAPGRPIVREPIPLGTLHGSKGSIRIERLEDGLHYRVFDALGHEQSGIRDEVAPSRTFEGRPTPDPRRGFAGVHDLDLERTVDP